jgi:hypothetical protein
MFAFQRNENSTTVLRRRNRTDFRPANAALCATSTGLPPVSRPVITEAQRTRTQKEGSTAQTCVSHLCLSMSAFSRSQSEGDSRPRTREKPVQNRPPAIAAECAASAGPSAGRSSPARSPPPPWSGASSGSSRAASSCQVAASSRRHLARAGWLAGSGSGSEARPWRHSRGGPWWRVRGLGCCHCLRQPLAAAAWLGRGSGVVGLDPGSSDAWRRCKEKVLFSESGSI